MLLLVLTQGFSSFGFQGLRFLRSSSRAWDSPQTSGWLSLDIPDPAHSVPEQQSPVPRHPWPSPLEDPTGPLYFRTQEEGAGVWVLCSLGALGLLAPELRTPGRPAPAQLENGSPSASTAKQRGPCDSQQAPRWPSVSLVQESSWEPFPFY